MNVTAMALMFLNLSRNKLSNVPLSVCTFTRLVSLDISDNPSIKSLPYEMSLLKSLKELNLCGLKKLKDPPRSSLGSIHDCTLYLQQKFSSYSDGVECVQLMVVGNSKLGKERLLSRMYGKGFKYNQDRVCVRDWEYRPKITKSLFSFRTWIFKILEDYQVTHHCFLSQRSIYVLPFDLNDGYEGVRELKLWLESISYQVPYSALILVGISESEEPQDIHNNDLLMQQAEMVVAAFAHNLETVGFFTVGTKNVARSVKSVLDCIYHCAVKFPFFEMGECHIWNRATARIT